METLLFAESARRSGAQRRRGLDIAAGANGWKAVYIHNRRAVLRFGYPTLVIRCPKVEFQRAVCDSGQAANTICAQLPNRGVRVKPQPWSERPAIGRQVPGQVYQPPTRTKSVALMTLHRKSSALQVSPGVIISTVQVCWPAKQQSTAAT
jgi:hypothetical protein